MTPEEEKAERERLEREIAEDLAKDLPHLLVDIHQESNRADSTHAPTTRTFARFASLLCVLFNRASEREEKAAKQSEANMAVQRDMLKVTRNVLWLSGALGIVAVAQVFLSYLQLKAAKFPNAPTNQTDQHETGKAQQPLQTPVERPTQH